MTLKLAKNWRFWGIDINVFMGDLSTLSVSLVLVAAFGMKVEDIPSSLFTCTTLLATFKDTALFFECKRTMSEMKSCISSLLNPTKWYQKVYLLASSLYSHNHVAGWWWFPDVLHCQDIKTGLPITNRHWGLGVPPSVYGDIGLFCMD